MSLLGRLLDLFEAKTHALVNRFEDPQQSLDLSYEKMVAGLQTTRRHLADVITERTALERQIAAATIEADGAENDARIALAAGREDLARAALRHKQSVLQKSETLREAHATLVPQVEKLVDYQRELELKIERFRTDKEIMKSSYSAAQAQVKITEFLTGIGAGFSGVNNTLGLARGRVEAMQARAEGLGTMLEQGLLEDSSGSGVERELNELRASSAIDADLARLKAEAGQVTAAPKLLEN
jgi:phage shock protein A